MEVVDNKAWRQLVMLILLTVIAYGVALNAPFYLDDASSILFDAAVQQGLNWPVLYQAHGERILTYASLAINYEISGSSSTLSYHLVNLAIHLTAGIAFWHLACVCLRKVLKDNADTAALLATAIFLLHPLQTQAVTYIVQRATELAAMFYLLALAAYVKGRTSGGRFWYAIALVAGIGAGLSKQNAATLPAAILLIEMLILQESPRAKKVLAMTMLSLAGMVVALVGLVPAIADKLRETSDISRLDYLATQLQVLWIYMGKLLLPVNLKLEYDTTLVSSWLNWQTMLALAGHIALIGLAWASRARNVAITFGIAFYYLAHSIESSIFPITDLAFEHRSYLPNAGLAIAIAAGVTGQANHWQRQAAVKMAIWGLAILMAALTAQRNMEWRDPMAFHLKNAELSPKSYRPWLALNSEYLKLGQMDNAKAAIERAVKIYQGTEGSNQASNSDLIHNLALTLMRAGRYDEVVTQVNHAEPQMGGMNPFLQSNIYTMRGRAQAALGKLPEAEADLRKAVTINVKNAAAWTNLGTVNALTGRYVDAKTCYEKALDIDPNQPDAQANLEKLRALLH